MAFCDLVLQQLTLAPYEKVQKFSGAGGHYIVDIASYNQYGSIVSQRTVELLLPFDQENVYKRLLDLEKENSKLRELKALQSKSLAVYDAILHEYEAAFMHGGAKWQTIQKLKDRAKKKANVG